MYVNVNVTVYKYDKNVNVCKNVSFLTCFFACFPLPVNYILPVTDFSIPYLFLYNYRK